MQLAVKRAPLLAISARKRRLLAFAVKKVLGTPANFDEAGTAWLVFSDPTINWNDVRRLLACVTLIAEFPDQEPPADWDEARDLVRQWAASRLPDWPADDNSDFEGWFERPWLRFNTEGMIPVG